MCKFHDYHHIYILHSAIHLTTKVASVLALIIKLLRRCVIVIIRNLDIQLHKPYALRSFDIPETFCFILGRLKIVEIPAKSISACYV